MEGAVAKIALQGATAAFDKLYTYIIPPELIGVAKKGCRVLIPFGRGNIKRQGMIFAIERQELKGLKGISSLIDKEPILNDFGGMIHEEFYLPCPHQVRLRQGR